MVFRMPRAVFFLVLVVVLCSRPMRRVFVGQGVAPRRSQRSRMWSSPVQHDSRSALNLNPLVFGEFEELSPTIDATPLEFCQRCLATSGHGFFKFMRESMWVQAIGNSKKRLVVRI